MLTVSCFSVKILFQRGKILKREIFDMQIFAELLKKILRFGLASFEVSQSGVCRKNRKSAFPSEANSV